MSLFLLGGLGGVAISTAAAAVAATTTASNPVDCKIKKVENY